MQNGITRGGVALSLVMILLPGAVLAQRANPHDAAIDAMRSRPNLGSGDQRRVGDWVQAEVDRFRAFRPFRQRISDQYGHRGNSQPFKLELATKIAETAATRFAAPNTSVVLAYALAQVLVDLDRPETFPGLIAGLQASGATARLLCVRGLSSLILRRSIDGDQNRLSEVTQALGDAGLVESEAVVLRRIYEALNYPAKVAVVFDVYVRLFDKRLAGRRGTAVIADGAEQSAFEFFRASGVTASLNQSQKVSLVGKLAVFLRLDAERYNTPNLDFREIDALERTLEGAEAILADVVGAAGGKVREEISKGGYGNRLQVLQEARKWVGHAPGNTRGTLNAAPWNLPVGAP